MSEEKQMRQLDDDEKAIMNKRLPSLYEEQKELEFAQKQANLMIEEGAHVQYTTTLKQYKKQLSAVQNQLKELNFAINITEKQLKEGVEVKNIEELKERQVTVTIPEEKYYDIKDTLEDKGCVVNDIEVKEE